MEACQQAGCIVCRAAKQSTRRYLDSWKYELFTEVGIRGDLRKSQGFCHKHTWELAGMGAGLPLAQAYRDIISDTVEQIQGVGEPLLGGSNGLLRRIFDVPPARRERAPCPACIQHQKAEERYLDTIRKVLVLDDFYKRFASSNGLCLEHFAQACVGLSGDGLGRLKKAELDCLQRLEGQLGELIRKHDYRFKDEERGEEMVSWRWAAGIVAGEE
jgi:hypothetical protein